MPIRDWKLAFNRFLILFGDRVPLPKKTIQNHVDNIWLLGGEIIRDVNEEPRLRKSSAEQLVRNVIHEDGGPLIHNGWEDEQRSFDSTCRKFHRFLTQSQR
jgi:hypothetical protein